jgi:hypothetical protein
VAAILSGVIAETTLRGYLLEETLTWLLRDSAYELLTARDSDPELVTQGAELRVRGRGATHQVDVLGQFAFTPAFSLPVRLFLEAKFYQSACGLEVIRNAFGVIQDVNQNYIPDPHSSAPRRRFQYCYALFSTNGFTQPAQEFALAHQISLIDLSGESFAKLRDAVGMAAHELRAAAENYPRTALHVQWIRQRLRILFGTDPDLALMEDLNEITPVSTPRNELEFHAGNILEALADNLKAQSAVELLIGFPAAPFIIPLTTKDKHRFLDYVSRHPVHSISLRRSSDGEHAEWIASPSGDPGAYELHFTLPQSLEIWISESEKYQRRRISTVKHDFLSEIMIYYQLDGGVRACQLRYEPGQLARR